MSVINEYWEALERLKQGKPRRCPKGSPINKDTVAIEAGRSRGSIKKSRSVFARLIEEINEAASLPKSSKVKHQEKLLKEKAKKVEYRERYHQSLNRELMLLERLAELEKQLIKYKNVVPFGKGV